MARPNFFCSIETLQWLLEHEPKSEQDDIDLTVDLIEAPYLFFYTSDAEAWELKVMMRGELYDHKSGSGVEKGSLRVEKESGQGSGTTSDEMLRDNMGAFFEACRRISRFIRDEQLEQMYDGLDPEEAGILLELDGDRLSARKVAGKERPDLMCSTLFGGNVMGRPYMEDFMERSALDMMDEAALIEAAEGGDTNAMERLAQLYLNGDDDVAQDFEKSAHWWEKLAETGSAVGQFNMGLFYAKGCGVKRDFTKAAEWMRRAAENGDTDAPTLVERYSGIAAALQLAERGDTAAMAELAGGYMMLGGSLDPFGPGEDYKESLKWARKASDAGCAAGYWPLALAYEHGRGVAEDHAKATELFKKGAELGDPNCQHSYGCRLINGDGVKKDAAQALTLFEQSAEQGYSLAYQALAHMYETGEGVDPDFDKELEYFEKACEAEPDNAELMRHAGFQYTNLMDLDAAHWLRGVQRAAYWLRRAADLGDMPALHGADMYEKILALHEEGKIPAGTSVSDCMRILSENGMPAEEAAPFSPFADPDWEEQWKKEREEYERKAAKEWLAAHEQDLDRGVKIVFADKKFVFDGTPDAELFDEVLAKLAEKGGVHRGAVSGKTDYLVCEPRRAGEAKLRNLKEQRVKGRCRDTKVILAEDFYRALGYDPEPEIRGEEPEEAPGHEETAPESEAVETVTPETIPAPLAEHVETDEKGLPLATPGENQHPHLDFLERTKGVLTLFGGMVNQTGTEYAFYSLRDDNGYSEPVSSALKRAVAKDRGRFALSERAKEMAEVFRVEIDCFDPGEDREQQILNGMLRRCTMFNDLRSFAWTLAAYCAAKAMKPADVDTTTLRSIAQLVQEREHLNYRADSYCPALCSGPDLHVYFLPDAASDEDRKTILDNVNEPDAEGTGLSAISSLDGLRAELMALAPAMEKIHAALLASRDRRRELSGAMADVLFAWCSMTYAARDPIFTEDGPVNNCFEHPDQKNLWEEQWKKQREEYERKAAEDWLKAHEKDLNRGVKIAFSGKIFVFDGAPDGDKWLEILEKLTAKGGIHRAAVSGQTDYLVCDPRRAGDAKIRNIKEQRTKGRCKDTKIVLAEDFYRALGYDPNPKEPEKAPEPEQKAAPAAPDASAFDPALKLTFKNGVRRGDGHYTIGIPDGFSLNEKAEGRAFIAYSPDGADEFDGRVILFDGERNEIDADMRSKLSPQALRSLFEGAAYNETLVQMFEEVGSLPLPEECPIGFASYGIDTNQHCYHCNVVLILGNARKQLRLQIGDVYHEDIPACEALVHDWLRTLKTDETPWKIPQTDDPEFAGALTNQLAERWAEVQSASLGALIGEYNAARDTRVQKYRTLSAKGRDSVEALKRDLQTMLEHTGKQFHDHFDRALTVLERFAADEKNLPLLSPMLASVEQELPESDRLSLQLDDEEIEARIPDLQRMKNRLKALQDQSSKQQKPAVPAAPDPKLNAEAEAFLQTKKRELDTVKRDWNRDTKDVRETVVKLVKEGIRPEISGNRNGNTIGVTLNFNSDTSKAEAYLDEVKKKINVIKRRIDNAIRQYDEKLTDLNNRGAMPDTMEQMISGLKQWAALERTLYVDFGKDHDKAHPGLSAQSKAIVKKWTGGSVAPVTPEARAAWEEKKRREAEERRKQAEREAAEREERKRREAERKAREEAEKKERERKQREEQERRAEEQRKERERKIAQRDAAEDRDREELDAFRPVLAASREMNAGLQEKISVNRFTIAALRDDGKVYATQSGFADSDFKDAGQFRVDDWENIKAISAGTNHTVGLKNDGTVVAVGLNKNGQCDVSEWQNITAISAGDAHTVGLKADGTVVCAGVNRRRFSSWKNIVAITSGRYFVLGLRADGTAVALGYQYMYKGADQVSDWKDVVSIAAGDFAYGVRKDGTVVSSNPRSEDVESWTDVVKLVARGSNVVALRADGTVRDRNTPELDWRNIVDIDTDGFRTIGLRADGTAAFLQRYDISRGRNAETISKWTDLAAARLGPGGAFGLRKDGTFVGNPLMQKWKISPPYPESQPKQTAAVSTPTVRSTSEEPQPAKQPPQVKNSNKSIGAILLAVGTLIMLACMLIAVQAHGSAGSLTYVMVFGASLFSIGYLMLKGDKGKK